MDLSNFYAGKDSAPLWTADGYREVATSWRDLGSLALPSGQVGVSDPFIIMGDFLRFEIPTNSGRVISTAADVSVNQDRSHLREAYLSLILSDVPPVAIEAAVHSGGSADELANGNFYGIPVDAGAVSFFDSGAMDQHLARATAEDLEDQSEDWIDLLYSEGADLPYGAATAQYSTAQGFATIIFTQSGWGDGFYPVLRTVDKAGRTLGLHIDLQVVGSID